LDALLAGRAVGIGLRDEQPLQLLVDAVLAPELIGERRHLEPEQGASRGWLPLSLGGCRLRFLVLVLLAQTADHNTEGLPFALAEDLDLDCLTDGGLRHDARQRAHAYDVLAVELDDDVAGLDAGLVCRALGRDGGHECSGVLRDAHGGCDLFTDGLNADTEPAAACLAIKPELLDNRGRD